jgi:heat-inducible transcriptional repressor
MLDERKAAILRAVVEEYIETAQPVGSGRVVKTARVRASAATVRNEMATLERDGYLVQPHTSAGRVPTDQGYRFFVDHLTAPGTLQPAKLQQVRDFFATAHGELEHMLQDTSRFLSTLTDCAAVVVGPPHQAASVRSVHVVGLAPHVALLVAVLSNGVVEKRTLELDQEAHEGQLAAASAHIAEHLVGRTLSSIDSIGPLPTTGDALSDEVSAAGLRSLVGSHDDEVDHVFVGGTSRMAAAFDAVETVRGVLDILEQQLVVVSLLRDVLDRGLSVAIGAEHGNQSLAECALVVAPYELEAGGGTVGVVGPTRMNYPHALAAVAVVSQRLGRYLSEG